MYKDRIYDFDAVVLSGNQKHYLHSTDTSNDIKISKTR